MTDQQAGEVIYGPLQVRSRLHPEGRVVTVHFSVKGRPEQQFALTPDAARELAVQLMRQFKRLRRPNMAGSPGQLSEVQVRSAEGPATTTT
jgi:hypothetical protein